MQYNLAVVLPFSAAFPSLTRPAGAAFVLLQDYVTCIDLHWPKEAISAAAETLLKTSSNKGHNFVFTTYKTTSKAFYGQVTFVDFRNYQNFFSLRTPFRVGGVRKDGTVFHWNLEDGSGVELTPPKVGLLLRLSPVGTDYHRYS